MHRRQFRAKMIYSILIFVLIAMIYLQVANLASFPPEQTVVALNNGLIEDHHKPLTNNHVNPVSTIVTAPVPIPSESTTQTSTTSSPKNFTSDRPNVQTSTTALTETTTDPNADLDEFSIIASSTPSSATIQPPWQPNKEVPDKTSPNKSVPTANGQLANGNSGGSLDLNVLFYSIFIVYVSFIKLIYHNVMFIKRNMTEPGILMIFGIIWELVLRQMTSVESQGSFPRFNSRIFFYLFLPSTVLESAALLSNKWLYLNLLPILVHSIFGTLFYAASLGFTIYSLSRQNVFNLPIRQQTPASLHDQVSQVYNVAYPNESESSELAKEDQQSLGRETAEWPIIELLPINYDKSYATVVGSSLELNNLTLADCLVFGTILSSVDSTTMLGVFKLFQVNDKLYYLTLGESLMNNAVVLVIFNLLLDFFNETRLTVVKIYIAIIQFFITLIGSVFVGLIIAGVALVAIRLTKRFHVPCAVTSYQNQCQAMVETLLILKLAYLTYTLAGLAGTSSIVSLATFGILQDQYIKHNLNLRSQLTFRQVVLATKTMGFSLVYPLLGMLLVEVADTSQFFQTWRSLEGPTSSGLNGSIGLDAINIQEGGGVATPTGSLLAATSVAASKLSHLTSQANLYWNFKFLSLVTLVTVSYRFVWVVLLSFVCNLFSSSQLKIKFTEQILVAYGGLKGPLAFALVHRLIEHEEYRDRTMRNKHLFIYTILFITFVSTIFKGSFIRPLVAKLQHSLCHNHLHAADDSPTGASSGQNQINGRNSATFNNQNNSVVFNEINSKVTEYMAHGLNSILGYTKSPYDRFVELNESHIKPFLTRDGSNTNWLSVFYDSLILDETLNDTCFYRSSAAVLQSYWHMSTRHRRPSEQKWRSANGLLGTIEEHADLGREQISSNSARTRLAIPETKSNSIAHQQQRAVSRGQFMTSRQVSQTNPVATSLPIGTTGYEAQKSLLKDYVLFNIKLEDARRSRRSASAEKQWPVKIEQLGGLDNEISGRSERQQINPRPAVSRMLSTTSSDEHEWESNSALRLMRHDRKRHLMEVERQLLAIDSAESTKPTNRPNQPRAAQHQARRQVARSRRGGTRAPEQLVSGRQTRLERMAPSTNDESLIGRGRDKHSKVATDTRK